MKVAGFKVESFELNGLGFGPAPVDEEPIHAAISQVPVVAAHLAETVGSVIAVEDCVIYIVVLQSLVIAAVEHHRELVLDV